MIDTLNKTLAIPSLGEKSSYAERQNYKKVGGSRFRSAFKIECTPIYECEFLKQKRVIPKTFKNLCFLVSINS
tara:strand:- start:29335 stop:29553 length:219 start_codon:yes stop_codon:yes gene_type:complete